MTEIGIYPAITASIGGKQRRLTLNRQWRRAIENGELERGTPVHYEAGPGHGIMTAAGDCPELAPLFDEIRGPVPQPEPEPEAEQAIVPAASAQDIRLAEIEAEIAAGAPSSAWRERSAPPAFGTQDRVLARSDANTSDQRAPAEWAKLALKRFAVFTGRSRRSEFWFFHLFAIPLMFVFALVIAAMQNTAMLGLFGIASLAIFIPSLAVTVRRLHDRDLSGWLVVVFGLLGLIPAIGPLFSIGFLIMLAMPGTSGTNQHGEDPKLSADPF